MYGLYARVSVPLTSSHGAQSSCSSEGVKAHPVFSLKCRPRPAARPLAVIGCPTQAFEVVLRALGWV